MKWPLYHSDLLTVGNAKSSVCIITLWTKKEEVMRHVPSKNYAILGQLYSKYQGISALLRNCLANKSIRHLVIVGNDLSGSGQALVDFFEKGVDSNHLIKGTTINIEKEIPYSALENLRKHIMIHDYRSIKDFSKFLEIIKKLPQISSYGYPEIFPEAKIIPATFFPIAQGICVSEKDIHSVWFRVLMHFQRFTSKEEKSLFSFMTVVRNDEYVKAHSSYSFTEKELEKHFSQDQKIIKNILPKHFLSIKGISLFL